MGYKIGKNSQGKLIIIKETPEEEKARLESGAGKIPVMVPILHNIAANVPAVRKYVEETPEMRNYEKFIPAAQVANFVGKTAKSMLFGNPTETDKKNEINRKIANDEPLTEEERNYSLEKNMMAVMDMATPTVTKSGSSGLDDIIKAQNIKNAGKDLTAMIQGVRKSADKVSDEFRYHTTSKKALENIKDEGLKPARGQYGKGVYFAPSEKMTGGYGSPDEVMIRINKNKLPTSYDEFDDQGWVNEIVPPKYLEYKEKGSNVWKPLTVNKVGSGVKGGDLISEARKYKSAEEFVNSQGKILYHGTSADYPVDEFKGGYLTEDKKYADIYQRPSTSSLGQAEALNAKYKGTPKTIEFVLDKKAKIFDYQNPQHRALINDYWQTMSTSGEPVVGESGQLDWTEGESLAEFLEMKELNFDGIKLDEGGGIDPISGLKVKRAPSIRILNPKVLKTKSQLTDIFNKANKVGGVQPRTPNGRYDFNNKLTSKDILESKLKELTKKEIKFTEDGRFPPMNMKDKKFYDKLMTKRARLLGQRY